MDDKINILVYVLFIAISIIGGIIQNANKKKAEEARRQQQKTGPQKSPSTAMPPISGPRETTNPFEEFLRRQLEKMEEPKEEPLDSIPTTRSQPIDSIPTEKSQPIDFIPTEIESPIEKTPANFDFANEGVPAFENLPNSFIGEKDFTLNNEIKDQEAFDYNLISKGDLTEVEEMDFDISKAIVYSEILKRPAY